MGIDVGSSGCKISVVDEMGKKLAFASRGYSFIYKNRTCELDAEVVWESVLDALREMSEKVDLSELETICTTSFGEMFVLLDENRNILRKSISYEDRRGSAEISDFSEDIYGITGATLDVMYALPKLMWIKNNEPDTYKKAKYLCMFADFILFKLGAEHHTDHSLAARTLMLDIKNKCWSDEILNRAGIKKDILGRLVAPGTPVGKIDATLARELKISENAILLAGAHDQVCAALGAGVIREGLALDGMGSNECIVPVFESLAVNEGMKKSNLVCVPYVLPGMYVTYAFNRTSGSLFKWYRELLAVGEYDELINEMPDSPTEILLLPHFAGAATPYMDDDAVGAMIGLKLSTTRGELTKGIIEGLNFEILVNLNCLKEAGFEMKELFVAGGMSKSNAVLQIKADILGIPIKRLANSETGTVGAAILGSVASGIFSSVEDAVEKLVSVSEVFYPDDKKHEIYIKRFEKYERMYKCIKKIERDSK